MMKDNSIESLEGEYAGFISRTIAVVLDIILANAIVLVVGVGTEWVLGFFTFGGYFSNGDRLSDIGQTALIVVVGLTLFTMNVVYPIAFWMITGQTVGKAVLGLRVVHVEGRPVSFRVALFRLIGYYVSAIVLFLGFIWVIFDDRRRGWHDKMAGTCVVYAWEAHGSLRLQQNLEERLPASQG